MIPRTLAEERERFRAQAIGPWYSGWLHFAFTSTMALTGIIFCLSRVRTPRWWELLTVPITFLYANWAEYRGHRGPMHHKRDSRLLRLVFHRHTLTHHQFFTGEAMSFDTVRDAKFVLFPPILILFFFGLGALPVGLMLALVATRNIAYLFAATAIGYFLCYEWLHFAYHLPDTFWIGRLPGVTRLRRHHQRHHDPALMQRWNFNITFPICDRVYGTVY